jgi:uncharacterized protein (DUF1501 family)
MKRRSFIKLGSTLSVPVFVGGVPIQAIAKSSLFNFINGDNDRVLVLIQLNGGNDGLNTLIPLNHYDNLANARTNLILPESELLELDQNTALHPIMTGVKSLYDNAMTSIIQSVGYPNQNRSHFRSSDIWISGSSAGEYLTTGWVGRHLDDQFPDYPENYPNDDCPDPMALTMGSLVSETCQGLATNFSLAINDIDNVATVADFGGGALPDNCYGHELGFIRQTIVQTNAYAEVITKAAEMGQNLVDYPESQLAGKLKQVARLVAGGLRTKIYVVSLGGFDTHAFQADGEDPTTGIHAQLLEMVSGAVSAFHEDLSQLGLGKRVISMTFSEFGRQIQSNDSLGTDHGNAAPLFVFGECVNPGIIGDNPIIPDQVQLQEAVPMQYDFRSVYGSILQDWFDVPEDKVRSLLYADYQHLPILGSCDVTDVVDPIFSESMELRTYPNPFSAGIQVSFKSKSGHYRISLYDIYGHEVIVAADQDFSDGMQTLTIETNNLAAGNYYLRIANRYGQRTELVQKGR